MEMHPASVTVALQYAYVTALQSCTFMATLRSAVAHCGDVQGQYAAPGEQAKGQLHAWADSAAATTRSARSSISGGPPAMAAGVSKLVFIINLC